MALQGAEARRRRIHVVTIACLTCGAAGYIAGRYSSSAPMGAARPLAAPERALSPRGRGAAEASAALAPRTIRRASIGLHTKRSAWLSAHSVWKYESPLADLEMLESAPEVKRIMNRLPDDGEIDWNIPRQLSFWEANLSAFAAEMPQRSPLRSSGMYPALDVAVLWAMVRSARPRRIIEIGAGTTTTVIAAARRANAEQVSDAGVSQRASSGGGGGGAALCEAAARVSGGEQPLPPPGSGCHVCVEPFRAAAINERDVVILPRRIQTVPLSMFSHLGRDDILFIDSSHVLQPYGDTLFELLWILPRLRRGVLVHVHDIFLPYVHDDAATVERFATVGSHSHTH